MKGYIKQQSANSYRIGVYQGKDEQGRKRYQWETVSGKKQAQKRLTELVHQANNGMSANPKGSLGEFIEKWFTDFKTNLSPTTYQGYWSIYHSGIQPALGGIKLKDLRPPHIQKYITSKLGSGVSAMTVNHHIAFLHCILETAVKWQMQPRNVVDAISKPKTVKSEVQTIDEIQADNILTKSRSTRYYPLIALALYSGLRQSELLALKWQDIELVMAELTVNKSSHRLNSGEYVIKTPKNASSNRIIALSPNICIILRDHLENEMTHCAQTGAQFTNDRLVFCEWDGAPLKPCTVRQYWRRLTTRLGYVGLHFHSLRHTHATWLLRNGTDIKTVSQRLGHSTAVTTLNFYAHSSPDMQRQAAATFDKILALKNR